MNRSATDDSVERRGRQERDCPLNEGLTERGVCLCRARPRNSEFGSGSIWPRNFSVAFRKSCFDEFLTVRVTEAVKTRSAR